jgi:glutathione S-transferase
MTELSVYTFSPDWGLPTTGPFALKLIKWLDLAGISYSQRYEDRAGKGPKGKNPWVELDGELIADSEIIISRLADRSGFHADAHLSAEQLAVSHAVRRMLEEHFHMVLEWELFVHPEGAAEVRRMVARQVPAVAVGAVTSVVCRHFRRQLHARGIARHSPEIIGAKGSADVDALEALLGDGPFLFGSRPAMADVSAYGLLAPMARWPMRTPVADYIKSRPALIAYLDRMEKLKAEQRLAA